MDFVASGGTLQVVPETIAELVGTGAMDDWALGLLNGADGARTRGLRHAMAALFQLSYSPHEAVIISKGNARPLTITRRRQAQLDHATYTAAPAGLAGRAPLAPRGEGVRGQDPSVAA